MSITNFVCQCGSRESRIFSVRPNSTQSSFRAVLGTSNMQVGSLLEVRSLSARPEHRTEISIWLDGDDAPPGWKLPKFISALLSLCCCLFVCFGMLCCTRLSETLVEVNQAIKA